MAPRPLSVFCRVPSVSTVEVTKLAVAGVRKKRGAAPPAHEKGDDHVA
jgi:hypothetical protein